MTDAIKALRDYLSKSPSVVYPQDVLEYLPAIEAENAKLRELLRDMLPFIAEEAGNCVPSECFMYPVCCEDTSGSECPVVARIHERARELGVDVP